MGYRIDLTGQKFGRWTVLEFDTNKNGQTFWKCKCECGNEKSVNGAKLKNGESKSCGCLNKEKIAERSKKNIAGQKFGRLLALYQTEERNNGHVVWHCQCDCGVEVNVPIDRLTGKTTQSCGCLSREKASERFGIDITGQKFGSLTVIERDLTQSRGHQWWLCKCDCGNPQLESVNGVRLRNGSKTQCSLCMPRSKGEEQIKNILLENGIPFIQEKMFEDCRFPDSNRKARFDFYVNNSYIIEFDGRQHIEPTSGDCSNWWSLDYVQSHDAIKNQYCADNNIPLIRIPYSKINYIKFQDLLPETSKYIKIAEIQ